MILTEPKNVRIRRVMAENGITQSELAKILMISDSEMCVVLKRELAKSEQDKIIEAIKEARA